jgi:dihydroxyacetone kinase DhaKLM complex PTS-EIIA-like component DhaM
MTVETVSIYQRVCTASITIKAGTECPAWGTETRQIEENIALNELESDSQYRQTSLYERIGSTG